jgi:signal transduction histidine kinase
VGGKKVPSRLISDAPRSWNVAPLVLVVIALVGSVAIPARQTWLMSDLMRQTTHTLAPARLLVSQLHAGLAEELALLRMPGAAIDARSATRFRVLADSDDQRMASLAALGPRLDTASDRDIAALSLRLRTWRRIAGNAAVNVHAREQEDQGPMASLVAAHAAALAAVNELSAALSTRAANRDQRLADLDRIGLGWNVILVIAALAALSAVAVLMTRERRLHVTTEARARREAALREAAESFAGAFTLDEIKRCVEEAAVKVFEAHGARIEAAVDDDGRDRSPRVARAAAAEEASLVIPLDLAGHLIVEAPARTRSSADALAYAAVFGHIAALAIEKVRTFEETAAGRERLQRVLKSRSRLIRGFSHDVKNPIGAADGYAALLSDGIYGDLAPDQLQSVQRIRRSIGTALRLIHDLHELAAAETGHLALSPETLDVGTLVSALADDYQAAARAAGLELRHEVSDGLIAISTDGMRVRQIISNLISNAIKYSGHGVVTVRARRVSVGPDHQPATWTSIEVSDEGPGIPVDKQEFIFEEFGRIAPHHKAGAGLGLAISRQLAQALGGQLTLQSVPGQGSTFTLWLPDQLNLAISGDARPEQPIGPAPAVLPRAESFSHSAVAAAHE